jgi:DNA helicase II / ATP-dependent DNA helicase PcrA
MYLFSIYFANISHFIIYIAHLSPIFIMAHFCAMIGKISMELLSSLNPKQQQAVQATKGPVLILAGAGSGKTTTLVHRIAYLIAHEQVDPYHILAVTFTNKAAKEMSSRVADLLYKMQQQAGGGRPAHMPTMGTFHSVCVRILRDEIEALGYKRSFTIFDSLDQLALVRTALKELDYNEKQYHSRTIHYMISGAKNELIDEHEYVRRAGEHMEEVAGQVYVRYQQLLRDNNALDFDDLIMKTAELFTRFPDVLAKYQQKFQYILVDEYQDTNHAQYTLVLKLAAVHRNICVVGDDWQSIYGWRGAKVQNILDFENDYPQTNVVMLEQNYRSTQSILDVSHCVISKNEHQKKKELWTENGAGEQIRVIEVSDERVEALRVVDLMREQMRRHPDYALNDFVVLYRTNAQSRALEEQLLRSQVPYRIVGGLKFYERKEVKDVLAYLRVLHSADDYFSFLRIVNEPKRGIGATTVDRLRALAKSRRISIIDACAEVDVASRIQASRVKVLREFGVMITILRDSLPRQQLSELIDSVLVQSGYKDAVRDGSEEGEIRWENIQELKSVASKYDDMQGDEALSLFLEEIALMTDLDKTDDRADALTLMTLHSAKGLEFACVFLVGMEEGLLPHSRALDNRQEMEEERRLCYVGLTRAKKHLYLFHTMTRTIFGSPQHSMASRFLSDIEEKAPHLIAKQEFGSSAHGGGVGVLDRIMQGYRQQPAVRRTASVDTGSQGDFYEEDDVDGDGNIGAGVGAMLQPGDRVVHQTFGKGTVLHVEDSVIDVKFDVFGHRKLDIELAPLEKVER